MNGTVDQAKVIGIANRLRIAPEPARSALLQELLDAIFAEATQSQTARGDVALILSDVRMQLTQAKDPACIASLYRAVCKLRNLV